MNTARAVTSGLLEIEESTPHSGSSAQPFAEGEALPLSSAQQRLWFLDQLEPNSPLYLIPLALRLRGRLQISCLEQALNQILQRHESLRTNIISSNGSPSQVIREGCALSMRPIDLTGLPSGARRAESERQMNEEAHRPINLESDLMIRAALWRLEDAEHLLLLTLHHISADEWSLKNLLRELAAGYAALAQGRLPALPELPIQYADYAIWQREWLLEHGPRQLAYWRAQLSGPIPTLDLPADHPRPRIQAHRGARQSLPLSPGLAGRIKELAAARNTTWFMALFAAFQVLLHRTTGQNDLITGSPVAGRSQAQTGGLIGFFVNTLVLRVDLSGDPTFLELLERVREVVLNACANSEVPFDTIVEEIHPERDSSRMPLLQAMFAVENDPLPELAWPELTIDRVETETRTAKFDLTFVVQETEGRFCAVVEYNCDLFEPETIGRFLQHFQVLLESIATDPAGRVSELPMITAAEREQLVEGWNDTRAPFPDGTLAALFENLAASHPDRLAVLDLDQELTYGELNGRANHLARMLRARGVGQNARVGLCLERSAEMIVAMLAILKAGGAYVPLDPAYPAERLALMRTDSDARVIVTQRSLAPALRDTGASLVFTEDAETSPAPNLPVSGSGDDLAYIIYTSGSTGRPKGALIPQKAVVQLVRNSDYIQIEPRDRVAHASSASFDAATFEIWGALLNGAALVIIPREATLAPAEFVRTLRNRKITTVFLTTALFNQIANEIPDAFRTVRNLLFGGERVDPNSVRLVLERGRPERMLHVYGPTETTTFATWHLVGNIRNDAATIPIGRPITNTQAYLLDARRSPVPIGVTGELYLGGAGLAEGYLNQPELTAERFVEDPFHPGERLYRTGDLARRRPDGNIEFLSRSDDQVKIRGFRIEPSEIELVLRAHPSVREAVVVPGPDPHSSGQRLLAYLSFRAGSGSIQDVREFLRKRLPDYMIPARFVALATLPLTANGKVDRRKLPDPDTSEPASGMPSVAPRNQLESDLCRIWMEVLGISRVSVDHNFFALGGHSLLAVKLFARIEQHFHRKLPLATLFSAPTIGELAEAIRRHAIEIPKSLLVEIQPHGTRPAVFWVHSLGGDGGGAFFYYRRLAQLLGEDQPSYGIRSPDEPFEEIPSMARHYIQQMRTLQPQGPYQIGGFCFGGIVAFEMARQLEAEGGEVSLLALLESAPPIPLQTRWPRTVRDTLSFLSNLRHNLLDALSRPDQLLSRCGRKLRTLQNKLVTFLTGSEGRNGTAPDLGDVIDMTEYPHDYVKYAQAHWRAMLDYRPGRYGGKVTLFRARKQPLWRYNSSLGWSGCAGAVTVNVIPGTHESMLEEPSVTILADELKACLAEAQACEPEDPPARPGERNHVIAKQAHALDSILT